MVYQITSKKQLKNIIGISNHRSAELDDILEEESDDENTTQSPVISSPSSNSPDGSFRLPNSRRNQNTDSTSSASSTDGRVGTPPTRHPSKPNKTKNNNISSKSHDSGFSDSAASDRSTAGRDDRATSSQSKPDSEGHASGEDDHAHCEVVHETRAGDKQYHVSKVYFYSVSDVLQQEQENEQEHISILDCETGRVRRGYAQPNEESESPILYPPMSPPMTRINVSSNEIPDSPRYARVAPQSDPLEVQNSEEIQLDPSACDNYYVLEHKPLPKKQIIGTSSLGRKRAESPLNTPQSPCQCQRSPSGFPKTNGSLYESFSLGRRCRCENSRAASAASRSLRPSVTSEDSSVSLPSPVWTSNAYDSFDDPLSVSRRSFRSNSDLSGISSGPTSPFGPEASITASASEYAR